ncbi:M4 family metallopeptidase [Nocardioides sp.]|uniref:M4 family metallopeptidase n=1 Tax=Nocardioides sp. TaxID=35761 RepID=UPI0037834351
MTRLRVLVGLGTIGALAAASLTVAPAVVSAAPSARDSARAALRADADGALRIRPGFIGIPAASSVDDPGVGRATPVVAAARTHLERYGAAVGVAADQLVLHAVARSVADQDVVRFQQRVDGVPVIGGEVVVGLRPDRELGSVLATVSAETSAAEPVVGEGAAAATARTAAAKAAGVPAGRLEVGSQGRWLLDPRVLDAPARLGTRTVWRFEVGDGVGIRRLVLVDVRSGAVLMNLDTIEGIDRVICDAANGPVASESPCSSGFARTEGGPASGVNDVNKAFEYAGAVSDFYAAIGGIDLTQVLGIDVGGVQKLASTVRFCYASRPCPYANAFWNGHQMYYGDGYASADDVVGHEMTHGIVDHSSELFYWGQSGAMNESMADIMGEIVDHRYATPGDSPTDWRLGEDLPIGAIRDLHDPTIYDQPDRMTSGFYTADATYDDNGGVHTNSGVGNKTAYLISQGGTFNGQTVTGIDGGDAGLTKTAVLYLDVITMLSSGSDFADLASVLDQGCEDLVGAGVAGFTAATCTSVHKAGLATELTTTPPNAPQPADAPDTCPAGTTKRVLFDSETGDPTSKFEAGPTWNRGESLNWGSNASSGQDSWYSSDPPATGGSGIVATSAIPLPAGQKSYLWFQHWRLLDYDSNAFYDGGVVGINDVETSDKPWVNGPEDVLSTQYGNPLGGVPAFGGDSLGWVASRLDLSSWAGQAVTPSFYVFTDSSVGFIGWFVDDVRVYTCDVPITNTKLPSISGTPKVGKTLTAKPGTWTPAGVTFSYQWLRNGNAIGGAKAKTYKLVKGDKGRKIAVRVTAKKSGADPVSATSKAVGPVT